MAHDSFFQGCEVSKSGFDASIGLAFSLELFKRYRRNGVVQAQLPRIPGMRGPGKAFVYLVDGEVTSAYLEDQHGQRHSSDQLTLCRFDEEKGPFEWRLLQSEPVIPENVVRQPVAPGLSACPFDHSSVPKVISVLPQKALQSWTSQQRDILYITLVNIDGENTIEEIRSLVPYASDLVDEALRSLFDMKVISIPA